MIHQRAPGSVVQGAIFEIVYAEVNGLPIPPYVLSAFGESTTGPPRFFNVDSIAYPEYRTAQQTNKRWDGRPPGESPAVPDMSRLQTRMWFYYRATRLIDAGCEALHLGQIQIMRDRDPGYRYWWELLSAIRRYAQLRNRGFVWLDAHAHEAYYDPQPEAIVPITRRQLLLDFYSSPIRPVETDSLGPGVYGARLEQRWLPRTDGGLVIAGGLNAAGQPVAAIPVLLELDNGGMAPRPGKPNQAPYVWGFDEISWFAYQPSWYQQRWIIYAYAQSRLFNPSSHFQIPVRRHMSGSHTPFRQFRLAESLGPEQAGRFLQQLWHGNFTALGRALALTGPLP